MPIDKMRHVRNVMRTSLFPGRQEWFRRSFRCCCLWHQRQSREAQDPGRLSWRTRCGNGGRRAYECVRMFNREMDLRLRRLPQERWLAAVRSSSYCCHCQGGP
jgi:hypothetical protein